jgi:hypothetical protein
MAGFAILRQIPMKMKKGKRKSSRNKSATRRMKKYSRKPQRIGEFRRGYRFFIGKPAKYTNTCHLRAVNAGSLDLHNELLRQVRSVYFKTGRSRVIRPD